jgi:hypothetical protein
MATKAAVSRHGVADSGKTAAGAAREIAINKTRGLAFARGGEHEEWQPIDPKTVAEMAQSKGDSHTKIGDNWFAVYKSEARTLEGHASAH